MKKRLSTMIVAMFIMIFVAACADKASNDHEDIVGENIQNEQEKSEESIEHNNKDDGDIKEINEEIQENAEKEEDKITKEEYYDDLYLEAFGKALEARWDASEHLRDGLDDNVPENEIIELRYDLLVKAETDILDEYRDKNYRDRNLQEYVISYKNGLEDQKETIEKYKEDKNFDEFQDKWKKTRLKRYQIICDLYDNYNIRIDSKYMFNLNSVRNYVYYDKSRDRVWHDLNDNGLLNALENGEVTNDDKDRIVAKINVTNTSEYTFKEFPVNLVIYEPKDDGTNIREMVPYTIPSWEPNEEVVLKFTTEQTYPQEDDTPLKFNLIPDYYFD